MVSELMRRDSGDMEQNLMRFRAAMSMVFWIVLFPVIQGSMAVTVKNCSYPAVYSFGDSLSDVGNSIAAFPVQFANAELPPNGILFPTHAADRFCDGKLLIDFLAFGVRRRPIYPVLRGISPDFTYGVSFAASGGTARASSTWKRYAGFNSPFSLDVQFEWLERTKVRYSYHTGHTEFVLIRGLCWLSRLLLQPLRLGAHSPGDAVDRGIRCRRRG